MAKVNNVETNPEPLSAKNKNSFAYKTLSARLPVIITKVIDSLHRHRKELPKCLGVEPKEQSAAEEETKQLIEELAKLKYELQTNKPITLIYSTLSDTKIWNDYYKEKIKLNPDVVYFNVSWLYSECYFYRRMREIFFQSKYFKSYDQFSSIKHDSFINCVDFASKLAIQLQSIKNIQKPKHEELFYFYTMTSLWGNKFDLSLSCGEHNQIVAFDFKALESKILVNDLRNFWHYVHECLAKKTKYRVDIVLDNSGYELFTDLCWVQAMHETHLMSKDKGRVHFHVKKMPWFVSDTMSIDFHWLMNYISDNDTLSKELKHCNKQFIKNISKGLWVVEEHDFWTLPHDFSEMKNVASDLYADFCQSDLIVFKGDLNYRKLVGDLQWKFDSQFKTSLRKFQPTTAICTLRTIKADVVVGINNPDTLNLIETSFPANWMETGEYAVISFLNNKLN